MLSVVDSSQRLEEFTPPIQTSWSNRRYSRGFRSLKLPTSRKGSFIRNTRNFRSQRLYGSPGSFVFRKSHLDLVSTEGVDVCGNEKPHHAMPSSRLVSYDIKPSDQSRVKRTSWFKSRFHPVPSNEPVSKFMSDADMFTSPCCSCEVPSKYRYDYYRNINEWVSRTTLNHEDTFEDISYYEFREGDTQGNDVDISMKDDQTLEDEIMISDDETNYLSATSRSDVKEE